MKDMEANQLPERSIPKKPWPIIVCDTANTFEMCAACYHDSAHKHNLGCMKTGACYYKGKYYKVKCIPVRNMDGPEEGVGR